MTAMTNLLANRARQLSDAQLVHTLRAVEDMLNMDAVAEGETALYVRVRAELISEVERRWPEADEAVQDAFEWQERCHLLGLTAEVDYVTVLLAAVPVHA